MEEEIASKKFWEWIPWSEMRFLLYLFIPAYITLIAFRINGVFKKDDCPKCGGEITRIPKSWKVVLYNILGLGILPLRQYKCEVCRWNGVRWSSKRAVFVKRRKRRTSKLKTNDNKPNTNSQ